jgi:hypothetical protein
MNVHSPAGNLFLGAELSRQGLFKRLPSKKVQAPIIYFFQLYSPVEECFEISK